MSAVLTAPRTASDILQGIEEQARNEHCIQKF
jgi:hypothetical protein